MTTATYDDILRTARRLPVSEQFGLAEALLRGIRSVLIEPAEATPRSGLVPLAGLGDGELQALANAIVSAEKQQQLQGLLAANRSQTLTTSEMETLDALLDEIDQVALLKARALYTLQLRQKASTSQS
ncbi:MAG: hypothetical protein AB1791_11675 [Chloroflexota bacterium]